MSPSKGNIQIQTAKSNPEVGLIRKDFTLAIMIMSNEAKDYIFVTSEKTNILSTEIENTKKNQMEILELK